MNKSKLTDKMYSCTDFLLKNLRECVFKITKDKTKMYA